MKKKLSLMLAVIMLLQIILPLVTIIWESGFTIKSIAADTLEATVDGITWTYELQDGQATNVSPKDKTTLPAEVIIPSTLDGYTVTSIEGYAFSNCSSLTSIEIPEGVTSIGGSAFKNCMSLTSITVEEGNQNYISENGILFNKEKTTIICYPAKKEETEYVIPSTVTSIEGYAFDGCSSLTSIEIPEGVTIIEDNAFRDCSNLKSIEIPSSVTSIENYAFYFCSNLTSIEIPSSVTSIGGAAFSYCSSLTSIEIPEGVTIIGDNTFSNCSSLTSIEIPEGVTSIVDSAFNFCSSLTSIEIPDTVTSIGRYAFGYCSSLTSIEIPDTVTSIGRYAFVGCRNLTRINVAEGNQNYISIDGVLFNKEKTTIICYPAKKEGTEYVIPSTVTIIGDNTFSNCSSLTSIEIPEGVTSIGGAAFSSCYSLTSIEIPSTVTIIGDNTFFNCSSLTSIEIPSSVTNIGSSAFYDCSRLAIYCRSNSTAETYAKENDITYIIDDEAPTITSVEGNPEEWTKESVIITVNANDNLSGLAPKAYSFDGGTTWQTENTKTYENYENVVIQVRDDLENVATHNVEIKIDKENPEITSIEENASEWTKGSVTLTVNANDSLSGLAPKAYSFDGGVTWQIENSKTYTENTNGIIVKVRDNLGNVAIQTVNITKIDKEAPTITSIEGNASEWTKGSVTLTVNASDNLSGLAPEAYSFDGGTTWQAESSKTYTENTRGIVIKVKDKAGNIETYEEEINITKIVKLTGIEISNVADKTEYIEGQVFDKTGMIVTARYDNGTTEDITDGYECLPTTLNTVGTQEITVTYGGKTATFNVTVVKKGDTNGDNKVDFMDILAINKHRLGKGELTGVYLESADVTGDGAVNFMDILQINKYRIGKIDSL